MRQVLVRGSSCETIASGARIISMPENHSLHKSDRDGFRGVLYKPALHKQQAVVAIMDKIFNYSTGHN